MSKHFLAPAIATLALLAAAPPVEGQQPDTVRPAAVTDARIAAGDTLYHGAGGCAGCHGQRGVGTADGPGLVSGTWRRGPGTYEWLVHFSQHAGPGSRSPDADPSAMRGPGTLDSTQVRAVAAYVWAISRKMLPGPADSSMSRP